MSITFRIYENDIKILKCYQSILDEENYGTLGVVMARCRCRCECINAHLQVLQFLKAKVRGKPGYEGAEEERVYQQGNNHL